MVGEWRKLHNGDGMPPKHVGFGFEAGQEEQGAVSRVVGLATALAKVQLAVVRQWAMYFEESSESWFFFLFLIFRAGKKAKLRTWHVGATANDLGDIAR